MSKHPRWSMACWSMFGTVESVIQVEARCLSWPLQGEMVQAKFGIPGVAGRQMEVLSTAVMLATLSPPKLPRKQEWRILMDQLSTISCETYRSVQLSVYPCRGKS